MINRESMMRQHIRTLHKNDTFVLFKSQCLKKFDEARPHQYSMDLNIFYSCHGDFHFKEKYLALGLECLQAWGRRRVIRGTTLMEMSVFEFVRKSVINGPLRVQFAQEVVVGPFVEKEYVKCEVREVCVRRQDKKVEEKLESFCTIAGLAELLSQREGIFDEKSVISKAESLGFGRNKRKYKKREEFGDRINFPISSVFFSDHDVGWDYVFEFGCGQDKFLLYLEEMGVETADVSQAFLNFDLLLKSKSRKTDRSFLFSYSWVWDEYLRAYDDVVKMEQFIIKYARLLCMRPVYIGPGPLDYIMTDVGPGSFLNVHQFFSIPVLVDRLLAHFVYSVGGGTLGELKDYIQSLTQIQETYGWVGSEIGNVMSSLDKIGVDSLCIGNFYVREGSLTCLVSGQLWNFMYKPLYSNYLGSFERYYFRLLMLSLGKVMFKKKLKQFIGYINDESEVISGDSDTNRENLDVGRLDRDLYWSNFRWYDKVSLGETFSFDSGGIYAILDAGNEATHFTLTDMPVNFVNLMAKRVILEFFWPYIFDSHDFGEFYDPGGPLIEFGSSLGYYCSCHDYILGLVSRGLLNGENLGKWKMSRVRQRIMAFWDRIGFGYADNVTLDLG